MKKWAYYNEFDLRAAGWLKELIKYGLIMDGEIDTRSICDVKPEDVRGFIRVGFFAGIGGWDFALQLAGWPEDREVWHGSCPCQSFSNAGAKKGAADERDLWPVFFELVKTCRPELVVGEQVEAAIRHGWLDGVCGDLEAEGYACGAAVLGAHSVSAPHIRQRLYWVAVAGPPHSRRNNEDGAATIRAQAADELAGCGEADWLAYTGCTPGRAEQQHDQGERTHSTAADGAGIGERREVDRLEHATLDGREQGRAESGGRGTARGCGVGGVGDCISTRLEGRQSEPGDDGPQRPTVERAGSAWSDFAIVHCRDGKARRVSYLATLQPLAHGLPVKRDDPRMEYLLARLGELGIDATAAKRMLKEARRNRVGCLRGAGNAIIPQVAAEFVRAFMETQARLFV